MRARGARGDVDLWWEDAWAVEVRVEGADVPLQLDVPLTAWRDMDVVLEGPAEGELVQRPSGERVARFETTVVRAGQSAQFRVRSRTEEDLER